MNCFDNVMAPTKWRDVAPFDTTLVRCIENDRLVSRVKFYINATPSQCDLVGDPVISYEVIWRRRAVLASFSPLHSHVLLPVKKWPKFLTNRTLHNHNTFEQQIKKTKDSQTELCTEEDCLMKAQHRQSKQQSLGAERSTSVDSLDY